MHRNPIGEKTSTMLDELEKIANQYMLLNLGANGIVYNRAKAETDPCKCFEYEIRGEKRLFCWTPGVIGALNKSQIEEFCVIPKKIEMIEREKIPRRLSSFIQASEACTTMSLPERLECMSKELEAKGIKL